MQLKKIFITISLSLSILSYCTNAIADGTVVDRIFHPYVTAKEQDIEWRLTSSQTEESNVLLQRLGYGYSFTSNFAAEFYAIGERDSQNDFDVAGYEIQSRLALSQQGQYWADWGAYFRYQKDIRDDNYEVSVGLLFEKEIGITSLTLNYFAINEGGKTVDNEWESEFRLQYRYRYRPIIQPSLELFVGEDFFGIGPGFIGIYRIEGKKQLKWEASFVTELSQQVKDHTLRIAIEYEF